MTSHSKTRLLTAALIACITTLNLAPALGEELPTARVLVSDLDLSTPHGQQRLERRIAAAIDQVCPAPASLSQRSRAGLRELDACRSAAANGVQQQLARLGLQPTAQQARQN